MTLRYIHAITSLVVLAILLFVMFACQKDFIYKKCRYPLCIGKIGYIGSISLIFVFAGIVLGRGRWIGYGLMGVGLILAIIDLVLCIYINKGRKIKKDEGKK